MIEREFGRKYTYLILHMNDKYNKVKDCLTKTFNKFIQSISKPKKLINRIMSNLNLKTYKQIRPTILI